jgi:hypothetical protein
MMASKLWSIQLRKKEDATPFDKLREERAVYVPPFAEARRMGHPGFVRDRQRQKPI